MVKSEQQRDSLGSRYRRLAEQLAGLFAGNVDPQARMATAAAVLHHKMPHFFWTGFYRLVGNALIVGPYQGPVACAVLEHGKGVCWACVERGESVLVPDVHQFPGHIPCDERSLSEVVVPVRDAERRLVAVLDVDSDKLNAFSEIDVAGLEHIADMIHGL